MHSALQIILSIQIVTLLLSADIMCILKKVSAKSYLKQLISHDSNHLHGVSSQHSSLQVATVQVESITDVTDSTCWRDFQLCIVHTSDSQSLRALWLRLQSPFCLYYVDLNLALMAEGSVMSSAFVYSITQDSVEGTKRFALHPRRFAVINHGKFPLIGHKKSPKMAS